LYTSVNRSDSGGLSTFCAFVSASTTCTGPHGRLAAHTRCFCRSCKHKVRNAKSSMIAAKSLCHIRTLQGPLKHKHKTAAAACMLSCLGPQHPQKLLQCAEPLGSSTAKCCLVLDNAHHA
jgi:hypothetical protein